MSLLFWRKKGDNFPENESSVAVSRNDPLPARLISDDEDEDTPQPVKIIGATSLRPIDVQSALTIDSTTGGVALTAPGESKAALITVYTAAIRFWVSDHLAPTTTTGHRAEPNDVIQLESAEEVLRFRAIREGGTSATLEVTYYG